MHEWMKHVDSFLQGLIALEGRGDFTNGICSQCQNPELEAKYRCLCCDNFGLVCQGCMVSAHRHMPFHRIEVQLSLLDSRYELTLTYSYSCGTVPISLGHRSNRLVSEFSLAIRQGNGALVRTKLGETILSLLIAITSIL
jgi:hypothetical protein